MTPMQPTPPRRIYPPVPVADRERIAAAVAFYVEHVAWTASDTERAEYERIAQTIAAAHEA